MGCGNNINGLNQTVRGPVQSGFKMSFWKVDWQPNRLSLIWWVKWVFRRPILINAEPLQPSEYLFNSGHKVSPVKLTVDLRWYNTNGKGGENLNHWIVLFTVIIRQKSFVRCMNSISSFQSILKMKRVFKYSLLVIFHKMLPLFWVALAPLMPMLLQLTLNSRQIILNNAEYYAAHSLEIQRVLLYTSWKHCYQSPTIHILNLKENNSYLCNKYHLKKNLRI